MGTDCASCFVKLAGFHFGNSSVLVCFYLSIFLTAHVVYVGNRQLGIWLLNSSMSDIQHTLIE